MRISRKRRRLANSIKFVIGILAVVAMFAVCCLDSPPPKDMEMCWLMVRAIFGIVVLLQILRLVER